MSVPAQLLSILSCPDCHGDLSQPEERQLVCTSCKRSYDITADGIICLLPSEAKRLPADYDDPDYKRMSELFDDAQDYFTDGNPVFRAIHDSSHKRLSSWAGQVHRDGDWICDLGCGQGYHFHFLSRTDNVIGVDIRLESLSKIREHFPDVVLIQANSCALPFKDHGLAEIRSVYALEHIYHLEDALTEVARVMKKDGDLYVGIPCEGGLAWTLGRELTSMRTMSKRYNLDYRKYIALEHCNTARDIAKALGAHFRIEKRSFFPLPMLPFLTTNLTATFSLKPK